MFFWHILAIKHFNQTLHREVQTSQDGQTQVKIVYPKFKNGDATARDVRVRQNFGNYDKLLFPCRTSLTIPLLQNDLVGNAGTNFSKAQLNCCKTS